MNTLQPGDIVDERYEVIEELGQGGMGTVYKAQELGLERILALKMLHPVLLSDDESRLRFKREGQVLSALAHKNLLIFYRLGIAQNKWPYIAMEFLEGTSLREAIDARDDLSIAKLLAIAIQICEAMESAHKVGIVHRDLKPANIMLIRGEQDDTVKIVDFGLAKILSDTFSQQLTRTGELVGTTYYMSPEQFMGKGSDARSDIYALGCILYEALSGAPPFIADNPLKLMHQHTSEPIPLLQISNQRIAPVGLSNVIHKSLAKEPDARYQSMTALANDLDLIRQDRGKDVIAPNVVSGTKKRRWLFSAPALLILLLAGIFALTLNRFNSSETKVFAPLSPPRVRASRTHLNPSASLARAEIECNEAYKIGEPSSLARMDHAVMAATEALGQIPETERALKFQAHLTVAGIYHKQILFRRLLHLTTAEAPLYRRVEEEIDQALTYAKAKDGTYYRPATNAFLSLADCAAERDLPEKQSYYLEQALKVVQSTKRTTDFPIENTLPGYDSGDIAAFIKSKLGTLLVQKNPARAEKLFKEAYYDTLQDYDFTTLPALDAIEKLGALYHSQGKREELRKLKSMVEIKLRNESRQNLHKDDQMAGLLSCPCRLALYLDDFPDALRLASESVNLMDATGNQDMFTRCDNMLNSLGEAAASHKGTEIEAKVASLRTRIEHLRNRRSPVHF